METGNNQKYGTIAQFVLNSLVSLEDESIFKKHIPTVLKAAASTPRTKERLAALNQDQEGYETKSGYWTVKSSIGRPNALGFFDNGRNQRLVLTLDISQDGGKEGETQKT